MRRTPFELVLTTCRRCGRPISTGNRSLFGNDAAKAELDRICSGCVTPEERRRIECEANPRSCK